MKLRDDIDIFTCINFSFIRVNNKSCRVDTKVSGGYRQPGVKSTRHPHHNDIKYRDGHTSVIDSITILISSPSIYYYTAFGA